MVKTIIVAGAFLHLIFFFLCFHVLSSTITAAGANSGRASSFTLELIHRDSIRSPYYSANLTYKERYKRLNELSDARLEMFESSSSSMNADLTAIRPPLVQLHASYMAAARIGTGEAAKDYFLLVDTGSALTWTQCEPCVDGPCFSQGSDVFDPTKSPTYKQVPCKDPICNSKSYSCKNDVCSYKQTYGDSSFVKGVLSRETFGFAEGPNIHPVPNLAFGCTHSSKLRYTNGVMAGILGMNGKKESFAVQLAETGFTNGRFSYCLIPGMGEDHPTKSGYLRFGDDIPTGAAVQQTPLVTEHDNGHYYLTLLDISVGGKRLNLDPSVFKKRPFLDGGVVIDNGSYNTHLVGKAFRAAKKALTAYFSKYNLAPIIHDGEICFQKRSGVETSVYPSMTFHFRGANLEVPGIYMFYDNDDPAHEFCWTVQEGYSMSLIGSAQQVHTRFTFDIGRSILYFSPENCAGDV